MDRSLLDILVDPIAKTPLECQDCEQGPKETIVKGNLLGFEGRRYPVVNGIPRFVFGEDAKQRQTGSSFGYKWRQRNTYDSPRVHVAVQQWMVQRYGFKNADDIRKCFGTRRRILDAGCGSGFSSSLWMDESWQTDVGSQWFGVDISEAIDVAQERLGSIPGTHFIQADVLTLPFREQTFDAIFSEGVLHHTPSTERALKSLVTVLTPGGEILFYVYRKKAPVREFTDDHIRGIVSPHDPETAWNMLRPLTKLGQALAELHAEVDVPEDVPCLGIKAGRYDVQRLIYWHFAKLYWNETFSFEENNHVNFDWYHPYYAHRHTEEEVRRWCDESGLCIVYFNVQESGLTVRAIRG